MIKRALWFIGLWMYLSFLAVCLVHAQNPQTQTAPLFATNAKYTNGTAPGYWPTQLSIPNGSGGSITAATGLNINIGPGTANCGSGTIVTYNGGTLALTASATNRIYLNTAASCVPAVKTSAFVSSDIPIATVVTSGSAITSVADVRTWASVPSSSSSTSVSSNDGSVIVTNNSGVYDLHVLTTQCYLGDGGLVGAFANSSGVVKLPLCIGRGPASFTVPSGADRLKLGINDDLFADNTGALSINVSKNGAAPSTVAVAGDVMPWSPTTNPTLTFGVNDGASPVDAITGLIAGDVITITYVSGTVKMTSTYPNVDADGYLTEPPGNAFGGGPTGSATAPTSTFYPTKYTVSGISKAMTGMMGDVRAHGPGYADSLVVGINGIPLCTSITPGNGKVWTYTTASSPNPCYDLETPASGFTAAQDLSGSSISQTVIGILGQPLPALSVGYPHWNGTDWVFDTPSTGAINGRVISSSTTAACGEYLRSDATTSITITLPSIVTGCTVVVQRNGTGAVTIDPGAITYDGVTTQLVQGTQAFVWTDGTGYHSTSPILPGAHCTLTPGLTNTFDCTGSGGASAAPVDSVQISDGSGGFISDSNITIDPVLHTENFGGAITGPKFSMGNLSTILADWGVDTTSASAFALTACGGTSGSGKYCDGGSGIWAPLPTVAVCADTFGSGTTAVCTATGLSVTAGSVIAFTTTTGNSGAGYTINVNGIGAKSVAKWHTTTLIANDICTGSPTPYFLMTYDGSSTWTTQNICNNPATISPTSPLLFNDVGGIVPTKSGAGFTTNVNQAGTFSATDVLGLGITLVDTASAGGEHLEGIFASYPTPPFTATAVYSIPVVQPTAVAAGSWVGMCTGLSTTGKFTTWTARNNGNGSPSGWGLQVTNYTTPSAFSSTSYGANYQAPQMVGFRFKDDGTNLFYYISMDGGYWQQVFTVAKSSSWIGASPTLIGPCVNPLSFSLGSTLLAWSVQ